MKDVMVEIGALKHTRPTAHSRTPRRPHGTRQRGGC